MLTFIALTATAEAVTAGGVMQVQCLCKRDVAILDPAMDGDAEFAGRVGWRSATAVAGSQTMAHFRVSFSGGEQVLLRGMDPLKFSVTRWSFGAEQMVAALLALQLVRLKLPPRLDQRDDLTATDCLLQLDRVRPFVLRELRRLLTDERGLLLLDDTAALDLITHVVRQATATVGVAHQVLGMTAFVEIQLNLLGCERSNLSIHW
ncbi:MAG: hypothetical protein WAT81_01855 [Candidatus Moraniibacteriota bacterium]